jgi:hypothetical protein
VTGSGGREPTDGGVLRRRTIEGGVPTVMDPVACVVGNFGIVGMVCHERHRERQEEEDGERRCGVGAGSH